MQDCSQLAFLSIHTNDFTNVFSALPDAKRYRAVLGSAGLVSVYREWTNSLVLLLHLGSPAMSLEFTILVRFLRPAFTRLGHECQDLLSPCGRMHVCTYKTSVYTLTQKSFWGNGVRTHVNSKGKMPSTEKKKTPQRRVEPTTLHQAGQRAQHTTGPLNSLVRSVTSLSV